MNSNSLTQGPIFKTLVIYSLPLIITNLVLLLFHAADVAVLGIMADDIAVAAVGACGAIISLLVNLFTGFATGADVLVAKNTGARNYDGVKRASGTAIIIALSSGTFLAIIVSIFAKDLLVITKCQADVLDLATLYMKIYFLGMPITMLSTFVSTILRATGDSVRPMAYMLISGFVNIGLNVLFVGVFKLTVAGVAIATVLSTLLALVLMLIALFRNKNFKLKLRDIVFRKKETIDMAKIAVPTCLCSIFFYIANVIIATAINSISTDAMSGNAFADKIDSIVYTLLFRIKTLRS
jgi:putative MATE family efflux protein